MRSHICGETQVRTVAAAVGGIGTKQHLMRVNRGEPIKSKANAAIKQKSS